LASGYLKQHTIACAELAGRAFLLTMEPVQPILEVAILNVRADATAEFEAAFRTASPIIASMPGYIAHELRRCVEVSHRYLLLVHWQRLEDHTVGFRTSPEYQRWRSLLHHFYDPFPTVEHYGLPLVLLRPK
jgi:heme-degrading monooxygenase HmoA